MIHEQRYSPDTCGCVFIETWDDAVNPEARVHVLTRREKICPAHAGMDHGPGYAAAYEDNRRKNVTHVIAALTKGNDTKVHEFPYTWAFDENRVLHVTGLKRALTPAQVEEAQAACDIQFGPGRVKLNG